jgi:hypothetical protein
MLKDGAHGEVPMLPNQSASDGHMRSLKMREDNRSSRTFALETTTALAVSLLQFVAKQ